MYLFIISQIVRFFNNPTDGMIEVMLDTVFHRYLRVPYTLNVRYHSKPRRPRATILFIHGIGNTGDSWNEVIETLPDDLQVISIDLLGFGNSPHPPWAVYSAKTQANSVLATFFKLKITSKVIIVGHSLGSLVAIEMAKRYPLLIDSLILCSPPLYNTKETKLKLIPRSDKILRKLYETAQKNPRDFVKLSAFAMKYELINKSFNVTAQNVDTYMLALEAAIVNQTSLTDAYTLNTPTEIIRGTLDPLIVAKNLKKLVKSNKSITMTTVLAGHEVRGLFVGAVTAAITKRLAAKK